MGMGNGTGNRYRALSMRDAELASIGGLPEGVWEEMGSRKEMRYTLDLQRNSNL